MRRIGLVTALQAAALIGCSAAQAGQVTRVKQVIGFNAERTCALFARNTSIVKTQVASSEGVELNVPIQCSTKVGSGTAMTLDFAKTGAVCVIPLKIGIRMTQNWHETITSEGVATLTCVFP